MGQPNLCDAARRTGRVRPREVELLVIGAPGVRGPTAFVFESEPAASAFAVTLRRAWPRAQMVLAPFSGAASATRLAAG